MKLPQLNIPLRQLYIPLEWLTRSLLVFQGLAFALTIATAGLLGVWIANTEKFLSTFTGIYTSFKGVSISIRGYPADVYISLIITGLSLIVSLPLLIPEVVNKPKLNFYLATAEAILSAFWLISGIIIESGAGMTDANFGVRLVEPYSAFLYPDKQDYFRFLQKAASVGNVIGTISYINFAVWGCAALLRFRVGKLKQRETSNGHRGSVPQPYNMESNGFEENDVAVVVDPEDNEQSNVLTAQKLHELRLKKLQHAEEEKSNDEVLKYVEIQVPLRPKINLTSGNADRFVDGSQPALARGLSSYKGQ